MTFHEAGRSIRQNGGAAAVRYEVSKGLAMDEESPAHKLAEQVRGRNDRLTDTELGRLSFLNGQAAAAILEEVLEDRDPETAKKVEQLLKNARTGAMDKVPLSDLEDLKERHKENVETAKMPHASGDSDITALQEVVKPQDSDTIYLPDIQIGHSLGAKAKNYDIMDLKTGEHFNLIEGTYLQNVEVFAGKGVRSLFRNAAIYAERFGGKSKDWQHVKGFGFVDYYGESRLAELHWAQCEGIGKYDFFIKGWME